MLSDLPQRHQYAHCDHQWANQAGTACEHGVTADKGSQHLSDHHGTADYPDYFAARGKQGEGNHVGGEVEQLCANSGGQQGLPAKRDPGCSEESPNKWGQIKFLTLDLTSHHP